MCTAMVFDYNHKLSMEEAKARLEALGDYLTNRHGIQVTWNGDKATFQGKYLVVKIEGELTVGPATLRFQGRDPGLLWRRKAMSYMQGKLTTYLDPGTPIERLPRSK